MNGGKNATSRAPPSGSSSRATFWSSAAPNTFASENASAWRGLRSHDEDNEEALHNE